jgi:hypothetical protein
LREFSLGGYRENNQSEVQAKCAKQFNDDTPMPKYLENQNNQKFDNYFEGVNWIPENHHLFTPYSSWGSKIDATIVLEDYIQSSPCEIEVRDGSTWTITRIGPFTTTTSGYHLVRIGWDNMWNLREKLFEFPNGIYHFSSTVDVDYNRIGNTTLKDELIMTYSDVYLHTL